MPAARKTADVKRASPATQGRRESAGGQESGTRSPATCVKRQSALNTPAKLERTVFAEVKITLLTSKGELLTNQTYKHGGRMDITTFEHFSMAKTGVFFKPQRRKANEGVRISNLNLETRMNSKDEFRQGTNITMRPMRGVGV